MLKLLLWGGGVIIVLPKGGKNLNTGLGKLDLMKNITASQTGTYTLFIKAILWLF